MGLLPRSGLVDREFQKVEWRTPSPRAARADDADAKFVKSRSNGLKISDISAKIVNILWSVFEISEELGA
jgi:hypothetical protein